MDAIRNLCVKASSWRVVIQKPSMCQSQSTIIFVEHYTFESGRIYIVPDRNIVTIFNMIKVY